MKELQGVKQQFREYEGLTIRISTLNPIFTEIIQVVTPPHQLMQYF